MAEYGYSTQYTGTRQPVLPPGYMEAATAPGRNLAAGIAQLGAGIGQAIQRYQTNKAENEAATQTFETLSGMAQQALASDPSYQALQNYYETGQLPQGVTEADLQRFSKKAEADRSMLNRMVGLGEKFGDMSVAKKKAAIGDMAMVLQQYQQRGEQETNRALREAQLTQAQIAIAQARAEQAGQQQLPEALRAAYGLQAGQAPTVPFRSVTSELLSKYQNLTPTQQAQIAGIAEQRLATPPAGLVPSEAVMKTPSGATVTYGKPADLKVDYLQIPGTTKVQAYQGGKLYGSPIETSNIEEENKKRGLTINYPEFKGLAPTQNEAIEFRKQYTALGGLKQNIARLIEIAGMDPVSQQLPTIKAESRNLVNSVQAQSRKDVIGEGVISESDRKLLDSIVPDPTKVWSFSESNKTSLKAILDRANTGIINTAKSLGLEIQAPVEAPVGQPLKSSEGIPRFQSVEEANAALGPGKTAMVRNPKTGQMQQYTTE